MMTRPLPLRQTGFTLVELAIVLIIVALLSTGLIFGLSAQRDNAERADAQRQLESIREALLGFAISNGRLPCPALSTLANTDTNAGVENCASQYGVIPWVSLGIRETDAWSNRFTYFASDKFTGALAAGNLASFTLATGILPDNDRTATIKDANGINIALEIPAVIVSHGSKAAGAYQPTGNKLADGSGDEAENSDADLSFVSRLPNDSYDDLVVWIVPSILKSRMVAAGRLP
jgi:prepilin-type N-terminal cleavage/methylation domain-containing protein